MGVLDESKRISVTDHAPVNPAPLRRLRLALRHIGGELALKRLGYTVAPALRDGLRHWVGEDVFLAFFDSIEDASRDGLRRRLGYIEVPNHIGVHRAGENGVNGHAAGGPKAAQRLRQRERGCLGDGVGWRER